MMTQEFDRLPGRARVWIYQANRELTEQEAKWTEDQIRNFTEQWQAHGAQLHAAGSLRYNRFVVLGVDEGENAASGCSIDNSVYFVKQLGSELNVDFFDRMQVAFRDENNDEVFAMPLKEAKEKIANGEMTEDTPLFNNLVTTKSEFDKSWLTPAGKSWLKNYFVKTGSL